MLYWWIKAASWFGAYPEDDGGAGIQEVSSDDREQIGTLNERHVYRERRDQQHHHDAISHLSISFPERVGSRSMHGYLIHPQTSVANSNSQKYSRTPVVLTTDMTAIHPDHTSTDHRNTSLTQKYLSFSSDFGLSIRDVL